MTNFYYAAYSYLDEWARKDKQFHETLAFDGGRNISEPVGAECLVDVAKYYGVIRTLRKNEEQPRLKTAYSALLAIESINENTMIEVVEDFVSTLAVTYRARPLSAASKFLWMRFRSPVLMYDLLVSKWLCEHSDYKKDDGYANFCSAWKRSYQGYESEVRKAASALKTVKDFTLACNVSNDEFESWISSTWFHHRVFDHYMMQGSA